MSLERGDIDNLLYARNNFHKENHADRFIDHYLEQYRIYIHVFNTSSERRLKSNEFFLGINTAIMGILGYLEMKGPLEKPLIFLLAPFVGIAICYTWYKMISSYRLLNRAKFKVIHNVEQKLPIALFETEWELLGKGKDPKNYKPLSTIERQIPIIFIILYLLIFFANVNWSGFLSLL